jgi:hypothetical protein
MSSRSPALTALLAKYGITPCNDGSCMFGSPGGMHTNGGCRCIGRTADAASVAELRLFVQRMGHVIRELDQQPEQIAAWLESPRDKRDLGLQSMNEFHRAQIAAVVRAGRWRKEQDRG